MGVVGTEGLLSIDARAQQKQEQTKIPAAFH